MSIQIYIRIKAIEDAKVAVVIGSETQVYFCHCGSRTEGLCAVCGTTGETVTNEYANIYGLDILMSVMGEYVYHDANHWGSNRKPILAFIEKLKLKAGEDWHEAQEIKRKEEDKSKYNIHKDLIAAWAKGALKKLLEIPHKQPRKIAKITRQ